MKHRQLLAGFILFSLLSSSAVGDVINVNQALDVEGYEAPAECNYDWILVSNKPLTYPVCDSRNQASALGVFCNQHTPTPLQKSLFTKSNSIIVEFCSDANFGGKGVEFTWSTVDSAPSPAPPVTPPSPPGPTCPQGVGGTYNLVAGGNGLTITSPGFAYQVPYVNNMNCSWTINVPAGVAATITTNSFDIEGYSSHCYFDAVIVSGISGESPAAQRFCRNSGPSFTNVYASTITFVFLTDSQIVRMGFSISITGAILPPTTPSPTIPTNLCNGSYTLNSPTENVMLYSPGWPNYYPNNVYGCLNLITNNLSSGPNAMDIVIFFEYFYTERDYDHLHLIPDVGPQRQFDGHIHPGRNVTFPAHVVQTFFQSDFSVTRPGYKLRVTLAPRPFGCASGQFKCATLDQCIPSSQRCDGTAQCPDSSDETEPFLNNTCGTSQVVPNIFVPPFTNNVVNGSISKPGSWPWAVSIHLYLDGAPDFQTCGGTLLSDQWILTAAHCVFDDLEPLDYHVKIGSFHDHELDKPYEHDSNVTHVFYHPSYDPVATSHDVGLMRLQSPVPFPFNKYTNVPCLPSANYEIPVSQPCVVVGWGDTEDTGSDQILRQAIVEKFDTAVCNNSAHYHGDIDNTMFCAGYEEGLTDTCQGDSGGPLVCQDSTSHKWVIQGITSWGYGCADPHLPGIYTKLSVLLPWVYDTVNKYD